MTCEILEFGPGELGFLCVTSSEECEASLWVELVDGRQASTLQCFAPSSFQCDFSIEGKKTCDRYLCGEHAIEVGPDRHLCPDHATQCPSCLKHLEIAMLELREFVRNFGCLECRWDEQ